MRRRLQQAVAKVVRRLTRNEHAIACGLCRKCDSTGELCGVCACCPQCRTAADCAEALEDNNACGCSKCQAVTAICSGGES